MSAFVADVSETSDQLEPFLERWAALLGTNASPFHSLAFLRAWYATLGVSEGRRPLLVGVRERHSGADVMLLALASRRAAGLRVVEFADATVCDYNLPLLSAAAAHADSAAPIWGAIRAALAARHDVLRLQKMPRHSLDGALPNPLLQALPSQRGEDTGTQVLLPENWDAWRHSLDKTVRKEFERSWRVFTRSPQAHFERITDPAQALRTLEQLEAMQSSRMHAVGKPYRLDEAPYRAFYRRLLEAGLPDGDVVLTALRDGDNTVAALFGVARGNRFIALRTANAGGPWANCSPGRLLLERTGAHLHERQGLRGLDFGIGDYAYKQAFKGQRLPLFDACEALSWRGRPWVWAWQWRQASKRRARARLDASDRGA